MINIAFEAPNDQVGAVLYPRIMAAGTETNPYQSQGKERVSVTFVTAF